jgi:hypothetical protein
MAKFTTNDLSDSACFALAYVQMLCLKSEAAKAKAEAQWKRGQEMLDRERVSSHNRRQMLAKGLAELREMGVIECTRDGEGDLVPTVYHEELLAPAVSEHSKLVKGDFQ